MSDQVARWRAQAEHARAQAGLSEQEVPIAALLAIIHVESLGQPLIAREKSGIPNVREYIRRANAAQALYAHLDTNHC